jgi:membrane protein implicated in regulation of membrane protease activity
MSDLGEEGLGGRFWLMMFLYIVGAVVAGAVILFLFTSIWYAWGLFGAFVLFGAVLLGFAWIHDKRAAKRYEDDDAYA